MTKSKSVEPFSVTIKRWLVSKSDKTLAGLIKVFKEKAFAIIFLLLMALPALPIPTGGITHITELITMLISLELIIGRRSIWLPHKWLKTDISRFVQGKAVTKLIDVIKWFEKYSRRRGAGTLTNRAFISFIGVLIFIFTLAAFVAPPFSGLDTLPALGVVIISLAIILEDLYLVFLGIIISCIGIGLEIAAGTALYSGLTHFF